MEASAKDLSRRDRNKLRNRKEIVDAALAVFAEKGYREASIQEIADRADFAVSTLYSLFDGKEDLYHTVSAHVGRQAGDFFDAAMAEGQNEYEKLVNFARAKGASFQLVPDGTRMLEHEQHDAQLTGDAPPKDGIGEIYARFLKRIEDLFATGIEDGLFVHRDPKLLATALDSMTNSLLRLSRTQPDAYSYDEHIEEMIAIFFEPVLADGNQH